MNLKIFDLLEKLPSSLVFSLSILLIAILYLPEHHAETLSISDFRDKYRIYLGPSLLACAGILLARFFSRMNSKYNAYKMVRRLKASLNILTPEEKGYLIPFMLDGKNTIYIGIQDGIIASLCAKGITYRASSVGDQLNGFAFNLHPWARQHLTKNLHLLDGYDGRPMTPREKLGFRL